MDRVGEPSAVPVGLNAELLRTVTGRIVDRFCPDRVLLFGSRARGDARPDSDYDVMIIGASDAPRWKRTVPVYLAIADIPISAEIHWWTEEEVEEWGDVRAHYIHRAMKEGIVLHEKIPGKSSQDALGQGA